MALHYGVSILQHKVCPAGYEGLFIEEHGHRKITQQQNSQGMHPLGMHEHLGKSNPPVCAKTTTSGHGHIFLSWHTFFMHQTLAFALLHVAYCHIAMSKKHP